MNDIFQKLKYYPLIISIILQLCRDIRFARENNELKLEEDLFAKLIFLFRSPETLIKYTRYRAVPPWEAPPAME